MLPRLACAIDVRPYAARAVADAHANAMDIAYARIHAEEKIKNEISFGITKRRELW